MSKLKNRYYVTCDSFIRVYSRPTKRSADRLAQKLANETEVTYYYYSSYDRRRARRMGKFHKVYLVPPITKN